MRQPVSTILENVMVQSVGQAAGVVAAGATFVVPAMYINQLDVSWWQIFLACFIGGSLGVVLIIPLRKYFVKDLHGELPFPEATAINNILVTGESSAGGAGKILLISFAIGALFDFSIEALHLWNANLSSSTLLGGLGSGLRIEVQLTAIAALFGLGYIIGIRYASIIASGSVLAMLVMVPLIYVFGKDIDGLAFAGTTYQIADMNATAIFGAFVKPIGIGAIAISGLIGILRMWKIVASSVTLGFKGFSKAAQAESDKHRAHPTRHVAEERPAHPGGCDPRPRRALLHRRHGHPRRWGSGGLRVRRQPQIRSRRDDRRFPAELSLHPGGGPGHRHRRRQPGVRA